MKKLTELVGERIETARKLRGITLEQLASKLGVSKQAIYLWERGGSPKLDRMEDVATALNVSIEYLLIGEGDPYNVSTDGKLPLISWSLALEAKENIKEWYACPIAHSKKTVVLKVAGESMRNPHGNPSFNDGDLIFVDPSKEIINGSFIVVKLPNNNQALFRKLIIEGDNCFLKALNPSWPEQIIKLPTDAEIFGKVLLKSEIID